MDLITGSVAALLTALCGLAGIVIGIAIDPVAAAIASAALLVGLVSLFVFALRQRSLYRGPYRILDETIVWQLVDPEGKQVFVSKRQLVRFNYLVIAHIELASGDGDIFADFDCNFGEVIQRFPRGGEEGLLIALRPERTRDEEIEITSRREIRDGFEGADQWITNRFAATSKKSEFIVEFPPDCEVENVRITGPSGHGSRPATERELRRQGDRQILRLKPRAYRENQTLKVTRTW